MILIFLTVRGDNMDNCLFSYKQLDVGDFFFDSLTQKYGIKLSPARYLNLDVKRVYGFAENHANDSDEKRYMKANAEWWCEI